MLGILKKTSGSEKRFDSARTDIQWIDLDKFITDKNIKIEPLLLRNGLKNGMRMLPKEELIPSENIDFPKFAGLPVMIGGDLALIVPSVHRRVPEEIARKYVYNTIYTANENDIRELYKENFLRGMLIQKDNPKVCIENILNKSIGENAEDIYFMWDTDRVVVKYRVDNQIIPELEDQLDLDFANSLRLALINMAQGDEYADIIDGKVVIAVSGKPKEFRISVAKTAVNTYAIVIRVYKEFPENVTLKELGFKEKAIDIVHRIMKNRYGIFLTTGPTGSGKTTSIYSLLREERDNGKIIKTAEDPVEIFMRGIDQFQINLKGKGEAKKDYNDYLKVFLRQHPDIIVIGEIREQSVAAEAFRIALTGHLVMSTLHTGSVKGTLTRLLDMQINKHYLEDTLVGILNQVLVPTLCECKIKKENGTAERNPEGCPKCSAGKIKGYLGKTVAVDVAAFDIGIDDLGQGEYADYYSRNDNLIELYEEGAIDEKTKEHFWEKAQENDISMMKEKTI